MAYKAKWYTDEGNLRSLGRVHLRQLLDRYSEELAAGGVVIGEPEEDDAYYRGLVEVFMRPQGIPLPLHEALYYIKGLDNDRGEERLVKAVQEGRLTVNIAGDCSTADKALLAWLADEDIVKELHLEVGLDSSRSFIHLQSKLKKDVKMESFAAVKSKIDTALAEVYKRQSREAWADVTYHPRGDEHVFVIRRTEPFRRETRHLPAGTEPLYYWPTEQDLVVYNEEFRDLRMNVTSKWQKNAYAEIFGEHLFGNPKTFFEGPKYSLKPIRERGRQCLEGSAHGIDKIRLQELSMRVNENDNDYRIRRADDVFEAYEGEGGLPEGEELATAKFKLKFEDGSGERLVTIHPPNRAKYMQDENGAKITGWLKEQGFIVEPTSEPPMTYAAKLWADQQIQNDPPKNVIHITHT